MEGPRILKVKPRLMRGLMLALRHAHRLSTSRLLADLDAVLERARPPE